MPVRRLGRDTKSVDGLAWNGVSFGDPTADAMWAEISTQLKQIALAELAAGNTPANILRNDTHGIVLLAFQRPPTTPRPSEGSIWVHTSFDHGNYCYDGTTCTYEDRESGDFLAFDDAESKGAL